MDERDGVELQQQQQSQSRHSIMKKDKKTENRFKSKFESLKKFPHTTSAFEKARAFLRSLDLKYHNRHEQPSSSTTDPPPSSSSNEDNQKNNILLNPISPITNISTTRITRVEKLNPNDLIVHRVINNDQNESLNYFQQKYKQYLKPSLLIPKQYYHDLINKRNQNYSTYTNRYDFYPPSIVSKLSSNYTYSTAHKEIPSDYICREIEYHQYSSSSSMLTWNQCVRRLNREYRLTIDALQQAKECLEKVYFNSKNINETKKNVNVTFCLPLTSINRIEQNKILPSVKFSKPKLVKPVELNTFSEPILSIIENDEKQDSIANIIKKFNDLSSSLSIISKEQTVLDSPIIDNELKEIPEEITYTVETLYKNSDDNKNELLPNNQQIIVIQEKTTEEEFNLAQTNSISLSPVLLNNNNNKISISLKNNKKSISHIPKLITTTTNASRLKKSPVKITTQVHVPSQKNNNLLQSKNQPLIDTNRVKSMVHQINTTTSSRSSIINKRPSRPITIQRPISANKHTVQRK